jgi:asparagine synthase (glutamine-hydrolysing)|tara:strand:+ start:903 stop:2567 length:1665 start_codon:yes stop_codon:yes gene_type:complete
MCGIVAAFGLNQTKKIRNQVLEMSGKIRHRGPDWSGIYSSKNAILAHERLSIVDPKSGKQPLYSKDKNLILTANGEIYNHQEIKANLKSNYEFLTNSDCEVILALYNEKGSDFLEDLNGIFSFALYDEKKDFYLIARDHMGIIPLYMGWDLDDNFFVASELKALEGYCHEIKLFPPGHYFSSENGQLTKWYQRNWENYENVKSNSTNISHIRDSLSNAVKRQLMSDVPYGVLLSGGLDSSITTAIAKTYCQNRIETKDQKKAWWPSLHSFSVGLKDSPDLLAAKKASEYIGTIHHEIIFTVQEGLDAIKDVIYHLETYDVTTIRASTPMYLMARVIKSMGIKMVISGEGADEIFGGYLYFHKAPNAEEFHKETVRKLNKLHQYDCLRANKSLAAWGIEGRVPFLDKEFLDVAMSLNPSDKMISEGKMEKWILRKAFEDLLPKEILWRQKEQFSDGVGYNWIDKLKELVNDKVSDDLFEKSKEKFQINPPLNKEEFYYRTIFKSIFPSDTAALSVPSEPSVACSSKAALNWDASFLGKNDPSGRAINNHENNYKN